MSELLNQGYPTEVVARLITLSDKLKKDINLKDLPTVLDAMTTANDLYSYGTTYVNRDLFLDLSDKHLDVKWKMCAQSNTYQPEKLLVCLPNGNYVLAKYLVDGGAYPWEWDNNNIVASTRLYGTTDILAYNTDPLDYLKEFKCLPTEKLKYKSPWDDCADDAYSGVAPILLGVELEVERRKSATGMKIERAVIADLGKDYAVIKHDGSLQNGFEIVTAPATPAYHAQAWDKFFDADTGSARHLTSWPSGRCGMHVHISRKVFTPLHMAKFIAFINNSDKETRNLVTTIAGRNNSEYAQYSEDRPIQIKMKLISHLNSLNEQLKLCKGKKESDALNAEIKEVRKTIINNSNPSGDCTNLIETTLKGGIHGHRGAINCSKADGRTIELRIFRGNISKIGFFKNIEFTHAAIEFTREATFLTKKLTPEEAKERKRKNKEHTDYALHSSYFLDWLAKDESGNYNNLKAWLNSHKISDKYKKPKYTNKTPIDKRLNDTIIQAVA